MLRDNVVLTAGKEKPGIPGRIPGILTCKLSEDLAGYDLSQMIPKVKVLRKAVLGHFKIL